VDAAGANWTDMALTVYCSKYILLNIAAVVNFRVE
jgi:hypothetical protein